MSERSNPDPARPDGQVVGLSDRERLEAQALLAAVVDSSDDAIVSKTLDGIILSWNSGAERLFGYTAAEAVGQPITMIIPPDLRHEERDIQLRLRSGERIEHFETVRVTKDGRFVDISLSISPVRDASGRVVGASKIARDITERRLSEAALREREERYRLVVAGADAAIWDWDVVNRRVLYSPRWKEMRGLAADEVSDRETEWSDGIHPEDRSRVMAAVEAHFAGRSAVFSEEYRVRHKDGHWIWILDRGLAMHDAAGRVVRMAGSETDITARKQAEEELRLSEERYRLLAQLLPVGVYTCVNPSGAITYFNDHAAALWGRTPALNDPAERFYGSTRLFATDGTPLSHDECPIAIALRDGREFRHQEVLIERPDGSRIVALINIEPMRDAAGRVIGAVNVFQDISAAKADREAMRVQKENLETLLETLPIPVLQAHDPECRRITGNRAASMLLRMPGDGNLSKTNVEAPDPTSHFRVVKDGRPLPPGELPIQRAARGETVRNEETQTVFDDGTTVYTLISAQPLYDAQGHPRGAVACMLDISELRKAERALRLADRRKDEFLATLAHELRNPLAPILNSLSILRIVPEPDAAQPVYDVIERQVRHMVRLVDDLLELSRITRGAIELRPEVVDVATIIASAVETSRPAVDDAGHELSVSLPPEPLRVRGDAVRLSQVFANLLNNAAKYTDPGGRIAVHARRAGHQVLVSVTDTGIGVAPEMLPRLFEMFSRVPNPLRGRQEGLGIGLSLVKTLVEMHGGRVRAHSAGVGHGSEFEVALPMSASEAPAIPLAPSRGEDEAVDAGAARRPRILVVDDNQDAVETLGMLLRLGGADVEVAYDGVSALEMVRRYRPSVVFTDLGLPGFDGYELARRVRRDPALEPVVLVALTGWGSEDDRRQSRHAGFDHHLVKPVDFEQVRALLRSLSSAPSDDL